MSKKIIIMISIFMIITLIVGYGVYQYRSQIIKAQKINKQYEEYYEIEILGTELISIINKTMDLNEQNEIPKDKSGYYITESKNAIKIYVQFKYKGDVKIVSMEDIAASGTESFIKTYSTENFKCTKIEYYEDIKNVKSLTFEEI